MRFNLKELDENKVNALMGAGYTAYQAQFLVMRGIDTPDKADAFFNFRAKDLRSVRTMKDADEFLTVIEKAVEEGKAITICGDYDADGIMATQIFMTGLNRYIDQRGSRSRDVEWYINDRFIEGYGLNAKSIDSLLGKHPDTELIITCDNGIKSGAAIAMAQKRGVEVIVSDHHGQSVGEELPNCPVVCEKRLDEDPNGEWFCGAELARRLVSELYIRAGMVEGNRDFLNSLLAYSGFATITDSVPMNAANHLVARLGIGTIARSNVPFWKCIKDAVQTTVVDEEVVGFKFGPMVNAASRVTGKVDPVMKALVASNEGDMSTCAKWVEEMAGVNKERQEMTIRDEGIALEQVEKSGMANALFILVDDVRFEPGINGLTASRLVEAYHVPAIAMGPSDDPDVYKGSARSIEGFNIFEALNDCRHLLEGFGGHPMAAGLSCRKDKITDLRRMLGILANKGGVKKTPDRNVDFVFDTDGLDLQSCDQFVCDIRRLAPFGPEFEKPVVGFEGKIYSRYVMKEKHLKYLVKNDAPGSIYSTPVIWWNAAEREGTVLPDALNKKICAIGYPAINEFNGDRSVQFIANEIDFAE